MKDFSRGLEFVDVSLRAQSTSLLLKAVETTLAEEPRVPGRLLGRSGS